MTLDNDGRARLAKIEAAHRALLAKLAAADRHLDQLAACLVADRIALAVQLVKAA